MIQLDTSGDGYEQIRVAGGPVLQHHRILAFAWGKLESPFFDEDTREIHHVAPCKWLNFESTIEAVSPEKHRDIDPGRARVTTPWDRRES